MSDTATARAQAAAEAPAFDAFVNGTPVSVPGDRIALIDPATGEPWASAASAAGHVDDAVRAAADALVAPAWQDLDASERGRLLWRLAALVEENAQLLARLEVMAAGKTLRTTLREIARAAAWYRFVGGAADKIEGLAVELGKSGDHTVRRAGARPG